MNCAKVSSRFRGPRALPIGILLGAVIALTGLWGGADAGAADMRNYMDLRNAVVMKVGDGVVSEQKAVDMLVDEVERRTIVRLPVVTQWPGTGRPVVVVGQASSIARLAQSYGQQLPAGWAGGAPEGYRIQVMGADGPTPVVIVAGNDSRGVSYGIGRLLRELRMGRNRVLLPNDLDINTAPHYPLRGHQLGFRPKVNTYDGWTVDDFEQYYRDLIVFGANAVELIPPRSDDADDSPHFPIPQIDMMEEMSRLADEYDLDLWIWYPALDRDYSDPATVEFALNEWGEVFKRLPRIDVVFVPGGDPGHTQPRYLMDLLEKQTENLHQYHPNAQMWMSPQSFTEEWMAEWRDIMQNEQPDYLTGVVFGPQNQVGLPELREMVPDKYPIRRYPDITHTIRSQYAVPDWDVAYAITLDREPINPRPRDYASIIRTWDEHTYGFLTYSEGVNDDVNKAVWSALGWDPAMDVVDALREYARYYIGEPYEDSIAQVLLGLEENWRGPLLTNSGVMTTLQQVQELERNATPQDLLNWRFQQIRYRAHYDAYIRTRLIYETNLEERAMDALREAGRMGTLEALDKAESILDKAVTQPVGADLRARAFELAEALYQSIRMQLSVPRYMAISVGRGANLDLIDRPLNDRLWLKAQFDEIRALGSERDRLERIDEIVNWTNPGPGGFYDDLGNLTHQPHLVRGVSWEEDPEFRYRARVGFAYQPDRRMSWVRHGESRWDAPLNMHYTGLDPNAAYKVRIVYAGEDFRPDIQLMANESIEIHGWRKKDLPLQPVEFDIPHEATASGELTLTWRQEPGRGGAGRGCQIAEVWLIKKTQ